MVAGTPPVRVPYRRKAESAQLRRWRIGDGGSGELRPKLPAQAHRQKNTRSYRSSLRATNVSACAWKGAGLSRQRRGHASDPKRAPFSVC